MKSRMKMSVDIDITITPQDQIRKEGFRQMKLRMKMLVDIVMTLTLLLLMAYERIGQAAHEWLGVCTSAAAVSVSCSLAATSCRS